MLGAPSHDNNVFETSRTVGNMVACLLHAPLAVRGFMHRCKKIQATGEICNGLLPSSLPRLR
jgi:hypothetical protein